MRGKFSLKEIEGKIDQALSRGEHDRRAKLKDDEHKKVRQLVFDSRTVQVLVKLYNMRVIEDFSWIMSSGKESVVLSGVGPSGEIAIKVYKVATVNWKRYVEYLSYDRRVVPSGDKAKLVRIWAEREYRNLTRMHRAEVNVPKPIAVHGNILVMQLIGEHGEPAPLLKDVYRVENPGEIMERILSDVKKAFASAELVHSDLSEYNVMYWKDEPWMIDVSQSVPSDHPLAAEFLRRDLENLTSFFRKRFGLESVDSGALLEELLGPAG